MKKFGDFVKLNEQEVQLAQTQATQSAVEQTQVAQPVAQPQIVQQTSVSVDNGVVGATTTSTEVINGSIITFVNKLFESRQMAHVYHLKKESYAQHVALQGYYDGVLDLVDNFVEVYQGQYTLLEGYDMILGEVKETDPIVYLEGVVNYVRAEKGKLIKPEDTHLLNIVDEIVALLYKTLYKLKHLK